MRTIARRLAFVVTGVLVIVCYQNVGILQSGTTVHSKKGVGASLWQEARGGSYDLESAHYAAQGIRDLKVSWYYTWDTDPLRLVPPASQGGPVFIPMLYRHLPSEQNQIFRQPQELAIQIERVRKHRPATGYPYVLLMNEPDNQTPDHPYQDPFELARETDRLATGIQQLATNVVMPVMAINTRKGRFLPWLEDYLSALSPSSLEMFRNRSTGRLVVPLHVYPDPFELPFIKSKKDLEDPHLRRKAKFAILNKVVRLLSETRRSYDAQIMVTEFGISDWATRSFPNRPATVFENRIPESFVVEVLQDLLPEFSSRAYVSHYAIFANTRENINLRTSASYDSFFELDKNGKRVLDSKRLPIRKKGRLTRVGRLYRDFRDVACQKGEFLYQGQYVEFFSADCGPPLDFGWQRVNRNGWSWNPSLQQYRRTLTPSQAGFFPEHRKVGRDGGLCFHERYAFGRQLIESKSASCVHDEKDQSWRPVRSNGVVVSYEKTWSSERDMVGIMGYYFEDP